MSLSQTPNSHVSARGVIPDATVSRLPMYHRSLLSLTARGVLLVSSEELAEASGVSSAKLRKDLSFLGSYGTRGVGYDVEFLLYQIARAFKTATGCSKQWRINRSYCNSRNSCPRSLRRNGSQRHHKYFEFRTGTYRSTSWC